LVDGPVNMGHVRRRPKRLADKLLQIRTALNLSQSEIAIRLEVTSKHVSRYERNQSEPPIDVLLAYARAVGGRLEQIVDDDQDLPP
jgi:transcriptional regulator with XRE-family HTH domain